jgi:hypothetical protein
VVVSIVRLDARSNNPKNLGGDGMLNQSQSFRSWQVLITYFIICNKVIGAHPLNLGGAEHPAHIIYNLNVAWRCLAMVNLM